MSATLALEVNEPTALAFTGIDRGFVGSRGGVISWFAPGAAGPEISVALDLSGDTAAEHDQGLVGMAVSPDGNWLYVNRTAGNGDSIVSAHEIIQAAHTVNAATLRPGVDVLQAAQPSPQHNGGDLVFDDDGYLYVSFGDSGGLGDPWYHGQDPSTPFGSVLRMVVDPTAPEGRRATPPPDNPFVGAEPGTADPLAWVTGVRNPFGMSYDPANDLVWVADAGQQCLEEFNALSPSDAGANLGWNVYEGTRPFLGEPLAQHRLPDYQYRHGIGACSTVGGETYRGTEIPALAGHFVFADFCGGRVYGVALAEIGVGGGAATPPDERPDRSAPLVDLGVQLNKITGITADPNGELYVTDLDGGVWRIAAAT